MRKRPAPLEYSVKLTSRVTQILEQLSVVYVIALAKGIPVLRKASWGTDHTFVLSLSSVGNELNEDFSTPTATHVAYCRPTVELRRQTCSVPPTNMCWGES